MTVVAAYVDREAGRVHLAADSIAVETNGLTMTVDKLVARYGSIVGVAGTSRSVPIVRRNFPLDPELGDDLNDWAQRWADRITAKLLEAGIVEKDDQHEVYGSMILAHGGRCWEIQTGVANPITCGYHAVGSGDAVAIGAMWAQTRADATGAQPDRPTALIPESAVSAAIAHVAGIGGPIQTASTP